MSHLVIDGYNLIRQIPALARHESISLEKGRTHLIHLLAAYRKFKRHKISLVFDGALNLSEFAAGYSEAGITIYFSPQGKTADQVIMDIINRDPQQVMVVSSDRELIRFAESKRCDWVSALEFYDKIRLAQMMDGNFKDEPNNEPRAHKRWATQKKGPSKRAPKKERRKNARMKNL